MAGGRHVTPTLPIRQADVEIVESLGSTDGACGASVTSEDDAHRPVLLNRLGRNVLTLGWRALLRGGQRHPQLIEVHGIPGGDRAVMPDALAGLHPFQAAGRHRALLSGRVL